MLIRVGVAECTLDRVDLVAVSISTTDCLDCPTDRPTIVPCYLYIAEWSVAIVQRVY